MPFPPRESYTYKRLELTTEIKLLTSSGSSKKQEFQKTSISALLTMPKPLCGSQSTVENSERDGNTRPLDLPLEKPICRSGSNS